MIAAALRTGRRAVCIEKDEGPMFTQAVQRGYQAYKFYKSQELLPVLGDEPAPPTPWEKKGTTWQRQWVKTMKVYVVFLLCV